MALLRMNGQPQTAAEQERASLLKKHFAAFNRKLESMVNSKQSAEYILNCAAKYNMTEDDLSEKVLAYIKPQASKPAEAPKAESKKVKKEKVAEVQADSSDSAAE